MTPHPRTTDCPTAHCAGFDPDTLRADRYPGPPLDEAWQGALDGALAEVRRMREQDREERGLCRCGCGERAPIAKRTNTKRGDVKGQPVKYIRGHYRPQAGPVRPCSIPECDRPHHARGWCQLHHKRWWKNGDPAIVLDPHEERDYERRGEAERFWEKVDKTETCWLWKAGLNTSGYGSFMVYRDAEPWRTYAHRWSYEHHVGPIPTGLHIDHLCRVRNCVNPDHLEPVTPEENTRRGAVSRRHEAADCGDHSRRCSTCGERLCAIDGPEPVAIACPVHADECADCNSDNPCRQCRDERRRAA